MRRTVIAGLLLGLLNAVVALAVLALVEALTPDEFGWYAYAPLDEVLVRDPRFPWQYVAVPLALVATNVVAVPASVRRLQRPVPHPPGSPSPVRTDRGSLPGS